jgi:hypothetical protein
MSLSAANTTVQPVDAQTQPSLATYLPQCIYVALAGWSTWQYVATLLLSIVAYDQCK